MGGVDSANGLYIMKPYPKDRDRAPVKVVRVKMVGPRARRTLRKNESRIIDEAYLQFVRDRLCACGCGKLGGNDPHHLVCVGWGQARRNDYTAIPMCRVSHTAVGKMGLSAFEKKYGVNLWGHNRWCLEVFERIPGNTVPSKARVCDLKLEQSRQVQHG